MFDIFLWLIVIIGYLLSIILILRTFLLGISFSRDAPFVPVNKKMAKKALELLELKDTDSFVDIGSGDGVVCFLASKRFKGDVLGVELDSLLVLYSNIKRLFYRKHILFLQSDMFLQNYSKYNKALLYLTTDLSSKIIKKLSKELPKNSIVVSLVFSFGKEFMKNNKVEIVEYNMGRKTKNIYIWRK